MTFVAHPYDRFLDDLLTALTGGETREDHRFTGVEEQYGLRSPDILPFTLRVYGQRGDAYALFKQGIDFDYRAEVNGIVWRQGAAHPDDQTDFGVNYYRQQSESPLTDRNPGSVNATLAGALARQFTVLHKQVQRVYRSAFVDFAEGSALNHVAALLDIRRKDARFAVGEILFKRRTPANALIAIPVGTRVSTTDGRNFETTQRRNLRKGQLSVTVPIRAEAEGAAGRVDAEAIATLNQPLLGIEQVINESPTFFGSGRETDDQFRLRVKAAIERAGASTVNAVKYALIDGVTELNEGNLQVIEEDDPGRVRIRFALPQADATMVRRIEQIIQSSRPAGVKVTHNLGQPIGETSAAKVSAASPPSGLTPKLDTVDLSISESGDQDDVLLPLRVDVAVSLAEPSLSAGEKQPILDNVGQRVANYVAGLAMGQQLVYTRLIARIMASDQVLDAKATIHAPSQAIAPWQNVTATGRKFLLEADAVSVQLMEERVRVSVAVTLVRKHRLSEPKTVDERLRHGIQSVLESLLKAVNKRIEPIEKSALVDTLATEVISRDDRLQKPTAANVSLSGIYDETGLEVNDASQITLAPNQRAQLEPVTIELRDQGDSE